LHFARRCRDEGQDGRREKSEVDNLTCFALASVGFAMQRLPMFQLMQRTIKEINPVGGYLQRAYALAYGSGAM
jgi:hypothetical protein